MLLRCVECAQGFQELTIDCKCPCKGLLEVVLSPPILAPGWRDRPLSVWRYRELLPSAGHDVVTLGEGGTPLLDAPRMANDLGLRRLQLKIEGSNPTGSFKDRGMTCAVSWAVAKGAKVLGCASTGNTAASMAAYAARAGVQARVWLPRGQVAQGKLAQAVMHGAEIVEVAGSFDDAMQTVLDEAQTRSVVLLNSVNPLRLEGQKTLMYEVLDQRDLRVPDRVVYPVGNAGNISAGHKALLDYESLGLIHDLPRLTGVQASGSAPIADAVRRNREQVDPVSQPETRATAIRIGDPVSSTKALRAIRSTGGTAVAVTDQAIFQAQRDLARLEGIFAEPASAAGIAGFRSLVENGEVDRQEEVVCVLTGHGLKDPG